MTITTQAHPTGGTTSAPSRERRGRTWWHVANSAVAASAVILAVVALTDGSDGSETPAPAAAPATVVDRHADRVPLYRYDITEQGRRHAAETLCWVRGLTPPQQC